MTHGLHKGAIAKNYLMKKVKELLNKERPSRDPNRNEGLLMTICWKEKVDVVNMCYLRIGDEILFVEEVQLSGIAAGIFSKLYPH